MLRPLRRRALSAASLVVLASCAHHDPLLVPLRSELTAPAPDSFLVAFETSRGRFVISAHRDWAPLGVDRFYYLARNEFYDGARFFRVIDGFVAQFGLPPGAETAAAWRARAILDDPVRSSNRRGAVAFARGGANSRTAQLFVNLGDNIRLDTLNGFGFPPIGSVVEGMEVVDSLFDGYGGRAPRPPGPSQDSIVRQGNAYLDRMFPRLDRIVTARVVREWP